MPKRIETHISAAYWCKADGGLEPAKFPLSHRGTPKREEIYWMDRLLEDGFALPAAEKAVGSEKEISRALTILLTGPPGTGKSTLALEMCYQWSQLPQADFEDKPLNCLYISAETNKEWPKVKAEELAWETKPISYFGPWQRNPVSGNVWVDTTNRFLDFLREEQEPAWARSEAKKRLMKQAARTIFRLNEATDSVVEEVIEEIAKKSAKQTLKAIKKTINDYKLDVLVVDSLNSIGTEEGKNALLAKLSAVVDGTNLKVLIAILETSEQSLDQWLYAFDTVIRLDLVDGASETMEKYLLRTIEIKKARFQSHVWGVHQMKFVRPPKKKECNEEEREPTVEEKRRAHPNCLRGGIFIFPSIPYHLSLYKRMSPTLPNARFSTGINTLDQFLKVREPSEINGGFPYQRCTGLIGMRGGHKSHLGYLSVLNHIMGEDAMTGTLKKKALIVSLREDEQMARETLKKIVPEVPARKELRNQTEIDGILRCLLKNPIRYGPLLQTLFKQDGLPEAAKKTQVQAASVDTGEPNNRTNLLLDALLGELERRDQLEVQFFPPGQIAPEEFYHRILMSVLRMKKDDGDVVVLFNSLDQLGSRFPLCARDELFVPAIIETLTANNVTSIFIGVEERGQPAQQYGLLSMADALISFERVPIRKRDYLGHIGEFVRLNSGNPLTDKQQQDLADGLGLVPRPVVLDVIRFSGGQAAKVGGILELNQPADPKAAMLNHEAYGKDKGLCFVPFSNKYDWRIEDDCCRDKESAIKTHRKKSDDKVSS